ncbi:MAG: protein-L-isoaspartate O-methyltransferase [Methanophagales archaeon]|nr:protein-L-isoaspartate O-methyltransferase [Methanophagales archaeon]
MEDEYREERERMVALLRRRGISTEVLEAMNRVKRHLFVPPELRDQAYGDYPLPIGGGQTISAPHMVAMMCDYLKLERGDKVLEIGAGSGYHAAVIAELIGAEGRVYTVERLALLVDFSMRNLREAGYKNVVVVSGDGTLGLPEYAPFNKICVTCAAPAVPPPLLEQLETGGRMVIPIGRYIQELYLVEKKNGIVKQSKCEVVFVPLIGRFGFKEVR